MSGKLILGLFELVIDPLQRLYPETQRAFLRAVVPLDYHLMGRPHEAVSIMESLSDRSQIR
jgi:hypothetical protein